MSGFSTKGVDTKERQSISKYLTYGINKAAISNMVVEKAKNTGSKRITFFIQGEKVEDKTFEGVDGAKGRVAKIQTSYMKTDAQYKDFMRQVGIIADKIGVRPQVDAIAASTIEEYVSSVLPLFRSKFFWWNIAGEEWCDNEGKIKVSPRFMRYGFAKALDEIDETKLRFDGGVCVEARNASDVIVLRFNKDDKYQYVKYVKPDDDFNLPGASAFQTPVIQSPVASSFELPNEYPESTSTDLPF